jgi:leucyl-tRNA synthetase
MAVPAHDQRDLDFANKYDIPVIPVILPPDNKEFETAYRVTDTAYVGPGTMINSQVNTTASPQRMHLQCHM